MDTYLSKRVSLVFNDVIFRDDYFYKGNIYYGKSTKFLESNGMNLNIKLWGYHDYFIFWENHMLEWNGNLFNVW